MIKIEGLCYICRSGLCKTKDSIKCGGCGYDLTKDSEDYVLISTNKVDQMIKEGEEFIFLDIRTSLERKIANIERTLHIPMDEVPYNLKKLDKGIKIIVFCHTGGRSFHVARYLQQIGYNAKSMDGGIACWAEEIDPEVEQY